MGIDMTHTRDNPNVHGGATCLVTCLDSRKNDYVICNTRDGSAKWRYDSSDGHFVSLHLPDYFRIATPDIKSDVIEWCRQYARCEADGLTERPSIPDTVRSFRDDPRTKAYRSALKNGQVSLEAYC